DNVLRKLALKFHRVFIRDRALHAVRVATVGTDEGIAGRRTDFIQLRDEIPVAVDPRSLVAGDGVADRNGIQTLDHADVNRLVVTVRGELDRRTAVAVHV